MGKGLRLLSIVFIILSVFSCKKNSDKLVIGISKIVSHPALDAIEKGIVDQLNDEGHTNIVYDFQNANGEPATANQIANKFASDKVKVAVGIATPTAQALVGTLKDIPVVFSGVTDPVSAGLVNSVSVGEKNVTGVSDMTPVKEQLEMLLKIKNIKKLGTIYSSNESNSVSITELLKKICSEKGIELIESTVTNSAEVKSAVQSIIKRVDGIYISTDNTVVSALSAVVEVANENKVPVLSADPSSANDIDVLAAYGFNYYQMGRETGKIIDKILKGEKTENIPTVFMTAPSSLELLINIDVAAKMGLVIPNDIINNAKTVIKDGIINTKK